MRRTDTTLDDPPASKPRASRTVATLRVLFSGDRPCEAPAVELSESAETVIGRNSPPPGVLLDDPRASRRHALVRVRASDRAAQLVNESRRGTEIDGVPVPHAPLHDGALITAGHTLLLFRWETRGVAADAAAQEHDVPVRGLIGSAPAMREVRAEVRRAGRSDAPVTLLGETGSGKEVVARAIHEASRRPGAFVAVNCAAVPEALAESQLFGHTAGAFTGARAPVEGFFRAAEGGTLFLDEVGELAPALQAKLLRALETGTVVPVGAARETPHRARIVTATHRDLAADVAAGRFRADLYARISDQVIALPPLRARREDVLPLLRHAYEAPLPPLTLALARALLLHPWPFNVRELVRLATQLRVRAAERPAGAPLELEMVADALARTRAIAPSAVAPASPALATAPPLPASQPPQPGASSAPPPAVWPAPAPVPASGVNVAAGKPPDRETLVVLLREHRGVVADIARVVGRSRKQVYRWIRDHGLDPDAYRAREDDE